MNAQEDVTPPPKLKEVPFCSNTKDRVFTIGCTLTIISVIESIACLAHGASIGLVNNAEYIFGFQKYIHDTTSFSSKTIALIVLLLLMACYGGAVILGNITLTKEVYRKTHGCFHRSLENVSQMNAFGCNLTMAPAMLNFLSGSHSPLQPSAGVALLFMGLLQAVLSLVLFFEGRHLRDTPDPEPTMEDIFTIDSRGDEMEEVDQFDNTEQYQQ